MKTKRNYTNKPDRKRIEKILAWYGAIADAQSDGKKIKKEVKENERNK